MFETILSEGLSIQTVSLCMLASLILGLVSASVYMFRNQYSKSFVLVLALLPVMVQMVILMVNGNLGAGVAVMGAFSLVRFRSVPGGAKEIGAIFFAMAIGLATGMGYLAFAAFFTLVLSLVTVLLTISPFAENKLEEKELKVTIPEDLNYMGLFDDLFEKYTKSAALEKVRTTNMGSLFELCYRIVMKDSGKEKEFLDAVRCRNGNLNLVCGRLAAGKEEL